MLLEAAQRIVASGPNDEPPMTDVIDAALTHLIESQQRFDEARDELSPTTVKKFNTSVLGLRYQTTIESRWR